MHPYPLDPVDRTLLNALQRDGRATVGDLAEAVSLSTSPCWRRVRALEEAGVIAGYHAHLQRQRVGWGCWALCNWRCTTTPPKPPRPWSAR